VVVEMDGVGGQSMVSIKQVHHTLAVHNHPVTNNLTTHTDTNHTVLGVQVVRVLCLVTEEQEDVKVWL
jgi:hypothetical protein